MTMDWTRLPSNVDFLALINWMHYDGTWIPSKITLVNNHEEFIMKPDTNHLNRFSYQDLKRNKKLSKCPVDILRNTCNVNNVWIMGSSDHYVQDVFYNILKKMGKEMMTCVVATTNMMDFQFLDSQLSDHEVINCEKDLNEENIIREYRMLGKDKYMPIISPTTLDKYVPIISPTTLDKYVPIISPISDEEID